MKSSDEAGGNNNVPVLDMAMLTDAVGYHLRRAQLASFRNFAHYVREPKATPTQFASLVLIEANPGLSQVDLGAVLDMDRATTMAVIDKLQHRKWVVRRPSKADRRKHALHLTARGVKALTALKQAVARHEANFGARLTRREEAELLRILKKLSAES